MLTFEYPFKEEIDEMLDQKWEWSSKLKQSPPSKPLDDLVKGMLNPDTTKRLRLTKVMSHEWLAVQYQAAHNLSDQLKAEELQQAQQTPQSPEQQQQKM